MTGVKTCALPIYLKLQMIPQMAISGRVTDDRGEPIQGVVVNLYSSPVVDGERRIQSVEGQDTNDLGNFRFRGLRPGHYFVCAESHQGFPASPPLRPYAGACYPGPPNENDAGISLAPGVEQRIDMTLSPTELVSVEGKVIGATEGVIVGVLPQGQRWFQLPNHVAKVGRDGTFTISDLAPGSYDLVAG